ncbi:MAG TPA: hypothetical protein VKE98_24260 [Gemmataceae bacterium]|nr:hypothetical protein [Gemmataceae bacterium]
MTSVRWAVILVILGSASLVPAQDSKYAIKTADTPPPKELSEPIRKLLGPKSIRFFDGSKMVAELWFRKEVPADATPEQIKNGVTYRELKQSEILGALKVEDGWTDYRKQKVKAGVYTMRLGFQPMDGDHTGSSMFTEFFVLLSAAKDTKTDLMEPKEMVETSMKSIGTGHPAVFMLFPNSKPGAPQLVSKENQHWVLNTKEDISVEGKKVGSIGIGMVVVGNAN